MIKMLTRRENDVNLIYSYRSCWNETVMIQNYNNKYGSNFTILYRHCSQSFHMQMSYPVLHDSDFWCHPDSNSASSNSWFHNYFLSQEQYKILSQIRISRWLYFYYSFSWASRNVSDLDTFPRFQKQIRSPAFSAHSTLITRDSVQNTKYCKKKKI